MKLPTFYWAKFRQSFPGIHLVFLTGEYLSSTKTAKVSSPLSLVSPLPKTQALISTTKLLTYYFTSQFTNHPSSSSNPSSDCDFKGITFKRMKSKEMKGKQANSKQAKQANSPSDGAKTTSSPAPFSDIGKQVKDLLTKDYNFDNKFILKIPHENGMVVTATGATRDQIFLGDISTHYRSKNATVDVKVDSHSSVSAKVAMNEIFPSINAVLNFNIPVHRSGKVDVQYLHPHANIRSSIGLSASPLVEFSTTIGTKKLSLGGELGFDSSTASFTKYNTGISLNTPDLSASLMLTDKGETLKMSFIQSVNHIKGATIGADLSHKFTTYENTYTFGTSYEIDSLTLMKTRISHNGRIGFVCQREWRPKSLITVSGEYDSKSIGAPPRFGLTLALKP